MAPTVEMVEQFATALSRGDFGTARSLLANDRHFAGPADEFHGADDYLGALRQLSGMVRASSTRRRSLRTLGGLPDVDDAAEGPGSSAAGSRSASRSRSTSPATA
jgi:hypothetical protein